MKVRIICYENVNEWILGKFAKNLNKELNELNVHSQIGKSSDVNSDINHHICYIDFKCVKSNNDTLMVTHVNSIEEISLLKKQLGVVKMGICMSSDTLKKLIKFDLPRAKLCYINPPQDNIIKAKQIIVGITSRLYNDGRKNEEKLIKVLERLKAEDYKFIIMGDGWNKIVNMLNKKNIHVEYYKDFNYDLYVKIMPTFDYYLYLGHDEGSMGFLDALAAGVKPIVTPQGFHLDLPNNLTTYFNDEYELIKIFRGISNEREKVLKEVRGWNWRNYALKHLELWDYIINKNNYYLFENNSNFINGVKSIDTYKNLKTNTFIKLNLYIQVLQVSINTFIKLGLLKSIKIIVKQIYMSIKVNYK